MKKIKLAVGVIVAGVMAIFINCAPVLVPEMAGPSHVVHASAKGEVQNGFNAVGGSNSGSLTDMVKKIINTMLFIVGILAVVMIIYSGIRYITAHGDKGQVASAQSTLIYSIVGLVVAIVSYAIVNFVIGLF
ncbi:MAG: hypothetical protein Q4C83_00150 [Candidatus Saccharibacteria bacterium]|nr:hypothetical protein [Candidatus Saccharibacteria bacterium]